MKIAIGSIFVFALALHLNAASSATNSAAQKTDPHFSEIPLPAKTVTTQPRKPTQTDSDKSKTAASESPSVLTNNSPAPTPSISGYIADDKYKLRVGDRVSFQILEDRDEPKSLVVADSGELNIPYVGRVSVADKTCKQLGDELKAQLEKEYYYHATVILSLDVANKILGRIYVWGQVKNQGPIDIAVNENLTVGKAILRAGGFGDFAKKTKVKVIRAAAQGPGAKQNFELNMEEILEKGRTEKDLVLQPDDSIIVPSRIFNF